MQNFNLINDITIQLPSGVFAGVVDYETYAGGELLGIRLNERNMLVTHAGELVPAFTETYRRKIKYSVEFYKSGMVKAVAFEEQQEIITPIGEFPAELVTFYETGELRRFFPLDGKISGMWTEEEEKYLTIPLTFDFPFAQFTAIINGVAFYKSGDIRSVTLFPGETIEVQTTDGVVPVRNGFSLYTSGELASIEPAEPTPIKTPIGTISAYNPNAVGINADSNSLVLDTSGRVSSLMTVSNRIAVQTADERFITFTPREVINPLDDETMMTEALRVSFDYDEGTVTLAGGSDEATFPVADSGFTVAPHTCVEQTCSPTDCASCSIGCK